MAVNFKEFKGSIHTMVSEENKKWAKNLIEYHKNPLIKIELPGTKFFLSIHTESEKEILKNALDSLTNVIRCERVERRCARAVANWLSSEKQAEVLKVSGLLSSFGFANKNGRFLYPEETLYLLETNRLELQWNKVPISIQQAYEIILDNSSCNLERYITYKKLLLSGFRLLKEIQIQKFENSGEPSSKKICLENCSIATLEQEDAKKTNSSNEAIRNIFIKLQESGPKRNTPSNQISRCYEQDYKLFLSKNTNKSSPDFNLLIYKDQHLNPKLSFINYKIPTIIGYTNSQFVGYYCMESVNIPNLI